MVLTISSNKRRVSIPSYGLSSFLRKSTDKRKVHWMVSMPSYGLSSFLLLSQYIVDDLKYEFQCPHTGSHHFYRVVPRELLLLLWCFNALIRALIISTQQNCIWLLLLGEVSMPSYGLSSFLPVKFKIKRWEDEWVSMPSYGLSSFLLTLPNSSVNYLKKFQCPHTGSHHFYSIFLKTLLLAVFRV